MATASIDILRGTLDLLILKALSWEPRHGYDVATWIERDR
jgi:PadR family transcriptional regulator, regulatory protein PadR